MKLKLFTLSLVLAFGNVLAQTDTKTDPRFQKFLEKVAKEKGVTLKEPEVKPCANHFYKTYQDFVDNKPQPGVLLKGGRTELLGSASYEVSYGDESKKMKVKELAKDYWGFCDRFGNLYRLTEKDAWEVILAGKLSQYVKTSECSGTLKNDSTLNLLFGMSGQGGYFDYASEGVNGEIIRLDTKLNGKGDDLKKLMSGYPEIYSAFLNDHDKIKYYGEKYCDRQNLTYKIRYYFNLINKQ